MTRQTPHEQFVKLIEDELHAKRISKAELARIMGVDRSAISRYLRGRSITTGTMQRIVDAIPGVRLMMRLEKE